jgi:hypothetical protein
MTSRDIDKLVADEEGKLIKHAENLGVDNAIQILMRYKGSTVRDHKFQSYMDIA